MKNFKTMNNLIQPLSIVLNKSKTSGFRLLSKSMSKRANQKNWKRIKKRNGFFKKVKKFLKMIKWKYSIQLKNSFKIVNNNSKMDKKIIYRILS